MNNRAIVALAVLGIFGAVRFADAHGYLKSPISRNYAARLNNKFYCEHCGQGNGAPPDVCGNPFQGSPGVNFTDPTLWFDGFKATWQSGQEVDITITLSTNHGGRMAVRLCPRDRFGIYPTCFIEPANQLRRVSTDPKYNGKVYWYLKSSDSEITQRFRLPPGVSCANGCVLQWWWVGYQNCYLPCESLTDDIDGECGKSVNGAGQCSSITQTEQFNNCADVLIQPSGTGPGASPPPPVSTPPLPRPSPSSQQPAPPPPRPLPPSPPPSPRPPPPPFPPPVKPPAPSPPPSPPGPLCPPLEWKCSECTRLAGGTLLGSGLEAPCQKCAATATDPWSCHNCFATSRNKDVLLGCLSCAEDGGGSGCSLICAPKSPDSTAMGTCVDCVKRGGNAWDCGNCFDRSGGNAQKRDACLRCVADRAGAWACAECTGRYGSACEVEKCTSCLRAGGDAWSCYTASYASACGTGRRALGTAV
ncbi:hypothetical protein VaNZ11_015263 [Volvox africanus]|uniref:Chitin-binding type-4 domain-containing protein n=1 Tax=Volvox africanus TaxID=51714 RepID=A0ABQ5SLP4_9CHLO|nr:hypothetical protein VaNZ11_015263 [Volvox africanus]